MQAKSDAMEAVELVNTLDRACREAMTHQIGVWKEADSVMRGRGPVQDPYKVNIKLNRLMTDVETVVPRFAGNLLGQRPYMPLVANIRDFQEQASAIEDLADAFTAEGGFVLSFTDAIRLMVPLGVSYVEPRYQWLPYNVTQKQVQYDRFGRVAGYDDSISTEVRDTITFVVHHPLAVRMPEYGATIRQKPYVIIAELVHRKEIERLLDQKTYKLPKGMTTADLKLSMPSDSETMSDLGADKSGIPSKAWDDIGLLLRYYDDERWITTWNRTMLLQDSENRNKNMYRDVKPIIAFRNMTHIGPQRWWPIGMYEQGRALSRWGDKILSRYFTDVMRDATGVILYNPDLVAREDLVAEPGNRIPVQDGQFERAIAPMKLGQPAKELFDLYNITSQAEDTLLGLYDYQRGSTPARKETATATTALTQAGNTRLEFGVLLIEQTGLADLAYLTTKLIAANITRGKANEILGFERAAKLPSFDPEAIPGGFSWAFRGSDKVQRQTQKIEKFIEVYNLLRPQQTILNPSVLDRKLGQITEVLSDEELDQMMTPVAPPAAPGPPEMPVQPDQEDQGDMMQVQPSLSSGGGTIMPPGQIATPATNQEMAVPQMA
mgnify:CR=1 FL=1